MSDLQEKTSHLDIKWLIIILAVLVCVAVTCSFFVGRKTVAKDTSIEKIDTLNNKMKALERSTDSLITVISKYKSKTDTLKIEKNNLTIRYEKAISHIDTTSVTDDTEWLRAKLDSIQRLY